MNESLIHLLALFGSRLNDRARSNYLKLLPAAAEEAVAGQMRQAEAFSPDSLSQVEQALLEQLGRDSTESPDDPSSAAGDASPESSLLSALLGLLCLDAEPGEAAALLVELPAYVQGEVIHRILTGTPLNITRDLAREEVDLVEALRDGLARREEWGVESACRILRSISGDRRLSRAITATAEIDEEAVGILQNHLFVFEDLMRLKDPELQVLMSQVDNATLAQALRMTSEEVRKRLLQNVSARRARLIAEEEELYEGGATLEEFETAQGQVMNAVRDLYKQGKISTYFGSVQQDSRPQAGEEGIERQVEDFTAEEVEEEAEEEQEEAGEEAEETEEATQQRSRMPFVLGAALGVIAIALVWLLTGEFSRRFDSEPESASTAADATRKQRSEGAVESSGKAPQVLVERATVSSGAGRESQLTGSGRTMLAPGQTMKTGAGAKAILHLPGGPGEVEVGENTEVEQLAGDEGAAPGELRLRMGRVRTTILEEGFFVSSPLVRVTGKPGAVFTFRVTMDATTIVEVEKGPVEVFSLKDEGQHVTLKGGQHGRFEPQGNQEIETVR